MFLGVGLILGSYTIQRYYIDISKYGEDNYIGTIDVPTSEWAGSVYSQPFWQGQLYSGEKLQIRVAMQTTDGTWWGWIYWNGVLNVYDSPTPPSSFDVPTMLEIDKSFNIAWSGATAGTNGIAGYDLAIRGFDGINWSDWKNLFSGNQNSYSSEPLRSLTVNDVCYDNYGDKIKFQYRVRTYDGVVGQSDWVVSDSLSMFIYSPTNPTNCCINNISNYKIKPNETVNISWNASTTQSGTLKCYKLRYTIDNGNSYININENIDSSTLQYSFIPNVRDGRTLKIQVCAVNSYDKESDWIEFPNIAIYTDGKSIGKLNNELSHLRFYVKIDDEMKQIKNIKVKNNGVFYNIDQFLPPQ